MPTKNTELKLPNENPTTEEGKKANTGEFIRQMVGLPKKAKDDKTAKPPEKTEAEIAAEKAAVKPEEKLVVKKKAARATPTPPALNAEDIATAVTAGVREATKRDAPKEPKLDDGLNDSEREQLSVISKMAELNPDQKELPKRFADSLRKLKEYKKDWESKNSGKKFDINDEEHADFAEANNVVPDPHEYAKAERALIKEEVAGDVRKEFTDRLSKFERAERARDEAPLVGSNQVASAKQFFGLLGGDFEALGKPDNALTNEAVDKIYSENPVYKKIVAPIEHEVAQVSGELFRLARGHVEMPKSAPTDEQWGKMSNVERNQYQTHLKILNFVGEQEALFSSLTDEQKLNQHGKLYITSDEWGKMSKAQQAKHWTLNDRNLASLYADKMAKVAKTLIDDEEGQFKTLAEKRGYKPGESAPKRDEPKPEERPTEVAERRSPPPSTVAPRMAPIQKPGGKEKKTNAQILLGR